MLYTKLFVLQYILVILLLYYNFCIQEIKIMQSRLNLTDEKKYLTANLTILQQRSSKHVVANTKNQLGGTLRSLYKRVPSLEQRKKETNCMACSSIVVEQELLLSAFLFPPTTTPFFGASSSSLSLQILHTYIYILNLYILI